MEIGVISSFVSVFISLGIVLVTYVKTWVSLDSSIKNLSKVVNFCIAVLILKVEEKNFFGIFALLFQER